MTTWYGRKKHLRYILLIFISQFKSDYSGVKSKSEVHIIRSYPEKKKDKHYLRLPLQVTEKARLATHFIADFGQMIKD